MSDVPPFWRGPLPKNVVPLKPSSAATPPAAEEPLLPAEPAPTYYKRVATGEAVVVNPNLCMICHRGPHRPRPHHEFIPDEATPTQAERLGWPMPTNQDPLL